jgi:hypothetical protein
MPAGCSTRGDPAGVRDQYAALLPTYERILGPESHETLTVRGDLDWWVRKAGTAG